MVLAGRGSLRGKGLEMAWGGQGAWKLKVRCTVSVRRGGRWRVREEQRAEEMVCSESVLCAGEQTQGWRLHSAMLTLGDMLRPSEGLWVIVWE